MSGSRILHRSCDCSYLLDLVVLQRTFQLVKPANQFRRSNYHFSDNPFEDKVLTQQGVSLHMCVSRETSAVPARGSGVQPCPGPSVPGAVLSPQDTVDASPAAVHHRCVTVTAGLLWKSPLNTFRSSARPPARLDLSSSTPTLSGKARQ